MQVKASAIPVPALNLRGRLKKRVGAIVTKGVRQLSEVIKHQLIKSLRQGGVARNSSCIDAGYVGGMASGRSLVMLIVATTFTSFDGNSS